MKARTFTVFVLVGLTLPLGLVSRPLTNASVHPKYGVHMHPTWQPDEDARRLARARWLGADVARIGPSWRLLEPQQGQWDTTWYLPALDQLLMQAETQGLQVLFMLGETPCWASSDPDKNCDSNPPSYCEWCPPNNPADYANALRFLVQRYGDRVVAWEVWNEPNHRPFWCDNPNAGEYVTVLQAAYAAVKAVDPDAVVLGGSLAGADVDYLEAMYAAGAQGNYDALALHPYSGTRSPDNCDLPRWSYRCGVERIRNTMQAYGDDRPIWFTEFGWSSFNGNGGVGEELQAAYLTRALELLQGWDYVPVAIWYNLVDRSGLPPTDPEAYFGLFRQDLSPKPAAEAYRGVTCARLQGDMDCSCTVDIDDLRAVADRWGQVAEPPFDSDGDEIVTVVDVMWVAAHWGETCSTLRIKPHESEQDWLEGVPI